MKENKTRVLVLSLILVIVVLLGFVLYMFVIKPTFTGQVINAQNEGYVYAFAQIMQQASTCQPVPLTLGNQTIQIINIECLPPELFQQPTG